MPRKPPKPFKPGQSGNPAGRPPEPKEVKEAKAFNKISLIESMNRLTVMTREQFQRHMSDPKTSMLDLYVGGQLMAGTKGKPAPADLKLFDRTLGSVNQAVEVSYSGQAEVTHKHDLSSASLTDEQFEILAQLNAPKPKPESTPG